MAAARPVPPAESPPKVLAWVRKHLGYEVRDAALFLRAITHRSAGSRNNERLEFLGDGVVNLVVARHLHDRYPAADEGSLSRLRASVVSGSSLARIATALDLGAVLELGAGELKTGGFRRESILADALEALFGAVYLEAGFEPARAACLQVLASALEALELAAAGDAEGQKDAKTRLQEWLQGRGLALPRYEVIELSGESHAQEFRVSGEVEALRLRCVGSGSSRRRAEQAAAQELLGLLPT
jgi:ribonuclease III